MKKIYIVEDTREIRDILEVFLTSEGFSITTFENIKDFNSRSSQIIPDLYLLDVMLPDGSGLDICNQIKSNPEITAPVIIMSANAKIDQMKNHCYPDDFIAKPFDLMKLVERINHLTTSNSLQE